MTDDHKSPRIGQQRKDVLWVMKSGAWHTFLEIQMTIQGLTGRYHPEASISARLRGFRADGYKVEGRKRRGNLWEYRVTKLPPPEAVQMAFELQVKESATLRRNLTATPNRCSMER